MDLYRVMLVDDEEEVRSAMAKRINWKKIGFKVVATAENGEDALEKAEQQPIDVVMTDIQMPFMDGLEMLAKLKEQMPGIKSVIFSGYDEFEYAKEAIRLEAEEYILKPIDANEMKQVFLRIKDRLDEEMAAKRNVEELKNYYQESIPILKEQLIISLLEGRISNKKIDKYLKEYGFNLKSAFYCIGVLSVFENENENELDDNLLTVSLKQIADEELSEEYKAITINYLNTIVVFAGLKSTEMQKDFLQDLDRVCKLAKRILSVDTMAGVGRVYGNIEDVSISFREAKETISYKVILEESQAVCISDIEPDSYIEDYVEEKQISEIIHEMKSGTDKSLKKAIDTSVSKLKNTVESIGNLQFFYTDLIMEMYKIARGHRLFAEARELIDIDVKVELAECKDMTALSKLIYKRAINIKNKMKKEREDSTKVLTQKALGYIAEHYSEKDLSVERLCKYLNVSATYFSSAFKKETGMSFVSYLTQERMEQAKWLLDTTDEKSYIIAGMVGYEEPNYFSYVFKKQYGVSPSKYRNS